MPPPITWNAPKAKVQLKLAVQRLRIMQQKKEAQAKMSRRDIATLLERGKIETARVKVENIINEDIHVELLELLELYCELLTARFKLVDQNTREPDPAVSEGICAIIHAAMRTELHELHILRELLMHKYGREFSLKVMENRDNCVSERVTRKLTADMPSSELVDAYLHEIAKAYEVNWAPNPPPFKAGESDVDSLVDEVVDGTTEEDVGKGKSKAIEVPPIVVDPKDKPVTTRLAQLPASPSTDKTTKIAPTPTGKPGGSAESPPDYQDDFDSLAKRFAALKKR